LKTIAVRVDRNTYRELATIAEERGWPLGEVVRDAIYEYLDRRARAKARRPASIFG